MMHEFLSDHREELVERCLFKVARRSSPEVMVIETEFGIPLFLEELIGILRVEQSAPGVPQVEVAQSSKFEETAASHGRELMDRGFTVEQVVHDYGDLCQAITELAFELGAPISVEEFRTLNRCLDNGIAIAVTAFNYRRDFLMATRQADELNERLGIFAHELRNYLNVAMLALNALKAGNLSVSGATAGVLDRSLVGIGNLVNRSLNEVRMTAGLPITYQSFLLADFLGEVRLSAMLEAESRKCTLSVTSVADPGVMLNADRDLLLSALGNLLQNAFKFTRPDSEVKLHAHSAEGRVFLDVQDQGFGLPPGMESRIFEPFQQCGPDTSGLGLGLSIAKRSVEANQGSLRVESKPGVGCVFSVSLPGYLPPDP